MKRNHPANEVVVSFYYQHCAILLQHTHSGQCNIEQHYLNGFFEAMPDQIGFDDIYEGMCTVADLKENTISLDLEDGRKLLHISVSPQIAQNSLCEDLMFMTLRRKDGKWYTCGVFSIGSLIGKLSNEMHMSINPKLMAESSQQNDFTKVLNDENF